MKVGDKVQLRRRISQKGGKTRLATEKVTILGIYPHHVQVRNQKGIVRSYINWEWQQLTSKEGMEGVESWRRKGYWQWEIIAESIVLKSVLLAK